MKKSIFILIIAILLLVSLGYAINRDCTSGCAAVCLDNLNAPGYNYLTANQNCAGSGPTIGANGVILDCKGYTITVASFEFGIDIAANYNNVVIQNCKFDGSAGNTDCIRSSSSAQNVITNTTFSSCTNDLLVNNGGLERRWYIEVNVSYTNRTPATGVTLQATNRSNTSQSVEFIINGTTDSNGFFRFNLTQNIKFPTAADNITSQTFFINASFGTFYNSTNVTVSNGNNQVNLTFISIATASNTAPYNITLLYPANNSQVNNTNTINFNFSVLDDQNKSLNCSLIFDSVINTTNITGINGSRLNYSNYTLAGITFGTHNWSVNCSDYELYNASDTFFFSVNDTLAPSYSGNSTNNTAARLNEDIQIYINLSDNNQLNFFLFEWNGSGTNNTNINGTIYQKTYNITLNLSINLSYGSVIAWKFRFNDSANIWNQTPYHYITVANTNPSINEILCYNLSKAINCSSLAYRNNLTAIRVNCTDADSQVLNISYNLTNINDSKVLIGSNATANSSVLFNYSYNQLINDSGLFNLTITCHDKANTTINSTVWYIEFGYLKTNLTIIFNSIEYTAGNVNARQHDWFKAILNITCLTAECGSVNASLDPATAAPAVHKPSVYAYTAAYLTLFIFLLIIVFAPILIIEDKKFTKKEDLILILTLVGIALVYLTLYTLGRLL